MRCAISGRQPGQSRYDLHVSPPQRNVDSDKIIGPTGSKHAVSRGKRCEPGSGEACRNSDQILLRHAQLKKTAGKLLSEDVDISVLTQIGGQSDDVGAAPRYFGKRATKGLLHNEAGLTVRIRDAHGARCPLFRLSIPHGFDASSWLKADSHSSGSTLMKWAFCRCSRKGTPLPINV